MNQQVAKDMRDQFFKDYRQLEHEIRKEQVRAGVGVSLAVVVAI